MEIQQAARQRAKLRLAIAGPSGSGKTYSSLLVAAGLAKWEKICVIDTENGSAHMYAGMGPYSVLGLFAPYTPERYIEALHAALRAGFEVVILDGISQEWSGEGGILDLQGKLADTKYRGNSWSAWREVTPRHNALVEAIQQSSAHVIATLRVKTEYIQTEEFGKKQIKKVGLAPIQRENVEYEFDLVFDLSADHLAYASKDRTGLFDGRSLKITTEVGQALLQWLNPVAAVPAPPAEVAIPASVVKSIAIPTASTTPSASGEYVLQAAEIVRTSQGQEFVKVTLACGNEISSVWAKDLTLAELQPGTVLLAELKKNKGSLYVDSYQVRKGAA